MKDKEIIQIDFVDETTTYHYGSVKPYSVFLHQERFIKDEWERLKMMVKDKMSYELEDVVRRERSKKLFGKESDFTLCDAIIIRNNN